jgi:hypothetical protein
MKACRGTLSLIEVVATAVTLMLQLHLQKKKVIIAHFFLHTVRPPARVKLQTFNKHHHHNS